MHGHELIWMISALEGFTETLAKEVDPAWNIKVSGGTPLNKTMPTYEGILSDYLGSPWKVCNRDRQVASNDTAASRVCQ